VRLYDDGRISAGNSDSPLASAPSSGRNTPVLSLDGAKLDRNTPVPLSLDAVRHLFCLCDYFKGYFCDYSCLQLIQSNFLCCDWGSTNHNIRQLTFYIPFCICIFIEIVLKNLNLYYYLQTQIICNIG